MISGDQQTTSCCFAAGRTPFAFYISPSPDNLTNTTKPNLPMKHNFQFAHGHANMFKDFKQVTIKANMKNFPVLVRNI